MLKCALFIAHIKAGEQELFYCGFWIPASAGMTVILSNFLISTILRQSYK